MIGGEQDAEDLIHYTGGNHLISQATLITAIIPASMCSGIWQ